MTPDKVDAAVEMLRFRREALISGMEDSAQNIHTLQVRLKNAQDGLEEDRAAVVEITNALKQLGAEVSQEKAA